MPRILITGASGFLGPLLAQHLLKDPSNTLILTDLLPPSSPFPENTEFVQSDLCSPSSLNDLLTQSLPLDAIYLFHGIMSSGAESNFELGMKVNLHSTLSILEALRHLKAPKPIRLLYASSQAVYGQPLPSIIDERVVPTPSSSYGAQKLVCETLVSDYTRRGYIDGLSMRFPTISIRPGKPTAAASSFLSGMIREPINGVECVIPIEDRGFRSWLCSPKTLAENLVIALKVDFGGTRVVNMPGTSVSVQEMMDVLAKVCGEEKLGLLREVRDEGLERILRSWGTEFDNGVALGLGFKRDGGFAEAVRDYVDGLQLK